MGRSRGSSLNSMASVHYYTARIFIWTAKLKTDFCQNCRSHKNDDTGWGFFFKRKEERRMENLRPTAHHPTPRALPSDGSPCLCPLCPPRLRHQQGCPGRTGRGGSSCPARAQMPGGPAAAPGRPEAGGQAGGEAPGGTAAGGSARRGRGQAAGPAGIPSPKGGLGFGWLPGGGRLGRTGRWGSPFWGSGQHPLSPLIEGALQEWGPGHHLPRWQSSGIWGS